MPPVRQNPDKNGPKEWSTHRRSQVIAYHQLGWSLAKIAAAFSPPMSKWTVRNIVNKFRETNTTENLPRSKRPRRMSDRGIRYLTRSILKDAGSRWAPLHQLKADLEDRVDASETTIRCRLKEVDLKAHPAVVKPFVSKETLRGSNGVKNDFTGQRRIGRASAGATSARSKLRALGRDALWSGGTPMTVQLRRSCSKGIEFTSSAKPQINSMLRHRSHLFWPFISNAFDAIFHFR
jgi:transposase